MIRHVVAGAAVALLFVGAVPVRAVAQEPLPPEVPRLTDADRAAAFPDVAGHEANDNSMNYRVLFDRFEWQRASGSNGLHWDNTAWVGKDTTRLWFRTEGESEGGSVSRATADVLFGHSIARWWDVVAGVRHDIRPGSPQTWAAIGLRGLAPYWFEIEATAYVGAGGRTRARLHLDYELLITNRLVLQPLVQIELSGKADPERGIGAGSGAAETGLRLRYEIRRELAPYAGLSWRRNFGTAGEPGEGTGGDTAGMKFVSGLRWWF